jgi:hypothetical protein
MKVDGQCHCGKITYTAEVDPAKVRICHCTDCQTITGSVYRTNVPAPAASFKLLTGQPKLYLKTTAASGNPRVHAFCPDCGTSIYAAAPENTSSYSLRIGALKQRAQLRPSQQIWFRSAVPWAQDLREVPQVDRQ